MMLVCTGAKGEKARRVEEEQAMEGAEPGSVAMSSRPQQSRAAVWHLRGVLGDPTRPALVGDICFTLLLGWHFASIMEPSILPG